MKIMATNHFRSKIKLEKCESSKSTFEKHGLVL